MVCLLKVIFISCRLVPGRKDKMGNDAGLASLKDFMRQVDQFVPPNLLDG